ncbi:MAG: cation transporter [Rhodospirillales bacterium]|nr:cation transporter [Rhodospirillales bacterium]
MGKDCCANEPGSVDPRFRRILYIALVVNVTMFLIEVVAGLIAGSVSLLADAVDFFGDAANYGISLIVLGMTLQWRARAALLKGITMGLFGLWVIGAATRLALDGGIPDAATMGAVGFLALIANVTVAVLLFRYRTGDSNMRSVWLCSRNDAIGNVAVMLAASGVFATGTRWPDLLVAVIMASLALTAAFQVIRQAIGEMKDHSLGAAETMGH